MSTLSTTLRRGDADVAAVARLYADPTRARVLMALADGRSLPASVLASEAGVSPQAASAQLATLTEGGLITGERSGRHRYYRLASAQVAAVLESLASIAPPQPVRSLRQDTRAAALRRARSCYDHLAGQLGCAVTEALLQQGALTSTETSTARRDSDALSAPLRAHPYRLGANAEDVMLRLGVDPRVLTESSGRPLLRFCLDWSEQRHHLAGRLGAEMLTAMVDAEWFTRRTGHRALTLTPRGRDGLERTLGVVAPS